MIYLFDDEGTKLRIQHKRERDGRIRDRIKAVLLHDKGGLSRRLQRLFCSLKMQFEKTSSIYRTSKKLEPESGGSIEKSSVEQSQKLAKHLRFNKDGL